jgi:signal transduction histidine kinase
MFDSTSRCARFQSGNIPEREHFNPMTSALNQQPSDSGQIPVQDFLQNEADRTILIVDDEEPVRKMFAEFLTEQYSCTTAASSDEALSHLAAAPYALVISDMRMPGRNGIELLREIRSRYPDTAVIMVSGIDRPQRIRDALHVGAFDYLIKPCELDVLALSVERALERRSLTLTARSYRADLERQNIELAARKAELERLQAQIVHSEKMASLGQLAAGIAHELNNPAGFIYGNMDLLTEYVGRLETVLAVYDGASLSVATAEKVSFTKAKISYSVLMSELRSMIADCREGAERIRDVVQSLRLFSRLDGAEVKKIDLHDSIESTIRLLSRYYGPGQIKLIRDYGKLPLVNCYAGQLNQVWTNVLVNAAQAVRSDGEVRISTRVEGQGVVVVISDNGCGIPADQLHKIFDPFFTTKQVGEGTGLGLSIIYGIIEKHGGSITAESEEGLGARFTISIPISMNTNFAVTACGDSDLDNFS